MEQIDELDKMVQSIESMSGIPQVLMKHPCGCKLTSDNQLSPCRNHWELMKSNSIINN